MKISELFEMSPPELRDWEIDPVQAGWTSAEPSFVSNAAHERLFDTISENEKVANFVPLRIGLAKKKVTCVAFANEYKPKTEELAWQIISVIQFYYPRHVSKLPKEIINPLQVQRVRTDTAFEAQGIASFMYALLAKQGYTIVSDKVQYLGGKKLWQKMAKEAGLFDYSIKIWNEEKGWLRDDDNEIIEYTGSNIEEALIWSKGKTLGQKTVMILSSKE